MPTYGGSIKKRQLLLDVIVSDPKTNKTRPYRALLDTGATISSISPKVLKELELSSDGWMPVEGVHGEKELPTCSVGLHVPITELSQGQQQLTTTSRGCSRMKVTIMGKKANTFDVLVGMDLLEDFHLTVYKNQFILSN
jgi:hypothetical protein